MTAAAGLTRFIVRIDGPTSVPRFWVVTGPSRVDAIAWAAHTLALNCDDTVVITIVGEVDREVGPA